METKLLVTVIEPLSIEPASGFNPTYRQFTLHNLTPDMITSRLGFSCNVQDDASKVRYSWAFLVNERFCALWDYNNSCDRQEWNAFGSPADFALAFKGVNIFRAA